MAIADAITNSTTSSLLSSATTTSKKSGTTSNGIASSFDQFLKLLTTQLQNQSPLDPLDTNQFTQQLVQFSQVEQQLKMNENLAALITANKAAAGAAALNYIGNQIAADGDTTQLVDSKASWGYTLPSQPSKSVVTIQDSLGNTVYTEEANLSAGNNTYTWNGRTSTGALAPAGAYKLIIDARNASGGQLAATTELKGVVDSIDMTGDTPLLIVNGKPIDISKVKRVERYT